MCALGRGRAVSMYSVQQGDFPFSRLSFQDLGKEVHKAPFKVGLFFLSSAHYSSFHEAQTK